MIMTSPSYPPSVPSSLNEYAKSYNTETVTYSGVILTTSKAAVKFAIVPESVKFNADDLTGGEYDTIWFPLSQTKALHNTFSLVNNTLDVITVTVWIAKQKGLVD